MTATAKSKTKQRDPEPFVDGETVPGVGGKAIQVLDRTMLMSIGTLCERAETIEVRTAADQPAATDLMAILAGRIKALDATRREKKDPWARVADAIDGVFRPHTRALEAALKTVKTKWSTFIEREEREQRQALERQREAERAAQIANPNIIVVAKPAPEQVARTVETSAGKVTTKFVWDFEVTDLAALMAAKPGLFDLSRQRLMSLIRSGETDIPGVRAYQRPDASVGAR